MGEKIRLDRFLTLCGVAKSRSDAKKLIRSKAIAMEGRVLSSPEDKIDPFTDKICFQGQELCYRKYRYYLLNKPMGHITATTDRTEQTVMDLLPFLSEEFFPVGRLDKDTEGLLLITNNGDLGHRLLSPKKHIPKTYFVKITGQVTEEGRARLENGIAFSEFISAPALYRELKYDRENNETEATLTITEGKFHQVKRMFSAIGNEVRYLKRIAMGGLTLPEALNVGQWMEIEEQTLFQRLFESDTEETK